MHSAAAFNRAMAQAVERNKNKQVVASKPSVVVTTTVTKSRPVSDTTLTEDQMLEKYRTTILSLALTYLAKRKLE